ncbi:hypothetical protein AURDEDRAFT_159433 [Auricularia subglabra TFB-10046 SS5]|nr:hypothetical protein AURDEDRAFT_159433 [Auricularia subglabra TFB-10046 SS5]
MSKRVLELLLDAAATAGGYGSRAAASSARATPEGSRASGEEAKTARISVRRTFACGCITGIVLVLPALMLVLSRPEAQRALFDRYFHLHYDLQPHGPVYTEYICRVEALGEPQFEVAARARWFKDAVEV